MTYHIFYTLSHYYINIETKKSSAALRHTLAEKKNKRIK